MNYTLPLDEWCRYLVTTYLPMKWWVGLGRAACRHQAHQFLWQNTLHKIDHSTRHLFIEQMALIYWTWSSSCTGCALYGRFWVSGFGSSAFEEEDRRRDAKTTRKKEETWCQCYTPEFYCKFFGFNLKSIVWVTAYRWKLNCTRQGSLLFLKKSY